MKVTGTIKEYVRSKVTDLYATKIAEYDKTDDKTIKKVTKLIEEIAKNANQRANDIMKENGLACGYIDIYGRTVTYDTIETNHLCYIKSADYEKNEQRKKELAAERDHDIMEIIATLELGGDKETLDGMLNEVALRLSKE